MLHKNFAVMGAFRELKARFARNIKGNISTVFAFSLIPIAGVAGAGVDYSRAVETRNQLQHAADAAALAGGRTLVDGGRDFKKRARKSFKENYKNAKFAEKVKFKAKKIKDGIRVDVSARMDTTFLAVVGYKTIDLKVFSEIGVSNTKLEVALVLDNTGSMQGNKIHTLKKSAKSLVKAIMRKKGKNEHTRIAIVPFADYVNIGMANRKEPGVYVRNDYTIRTVHPGGTSCWNTYPNSTRSCTTTGGSSGYWGTCYGSSTNDGIVSTYSYSCKKGASSGTTTCTGSYGSPVRHCRSYPTTYSYTHYKWYGCVGSRNYPLDTRDSNYSTKVPGLLATSNNCKPAEMLRLNDNRSKVLKALNAMKADGETYIPSGLMWGWRAISSGIPFADGVAYGKTPAERKKRRKVIVLMTDGINTKSPTYPTHHGSNTNRANNLTKKICKNIKKKHITVYTIAFEVKNAAVKKLLKDCVGNGGAYFDAKSSKELKMAFQNIALALMNLRLTR
jgi:Flp pilus assembly protein TadG